MVQALARGSGGRSCQPQPNKAGHSHNGRPLALSPAILDTYVIAVEVNSKFGGPVGRKMPPHATRNDSGQQLTKMGGTRKHCPEITGKNFSEGWKLGLDKIFQPYSLELVCGWSSASRHSRLG